MAIRHTPPRRAAAAMTADDKRAYPFRDANNVLVVTIEVPADIDATPAALEWKSEFETAPGAPKVKIINLVLRDKDGKAVKVFDSPFTIRVKHATGNARLKYFDPDRQAWVDFGVEVVNGEFVVNRNTWFDDPGIGSDDR